MICSLITTAKLNGVEPYAYLKDVLERLAAGHPISGIGDLTPLKLATENSVNR